MSIDDTNKSEQKKKWWRSNCSQKTLGMIS